MAAGRVRARSREWPARAMSEAQWQGLVVSFAQLHGWWCYHPHDSRKSEPGWPDLTLIRAPELLFVELKKLNGKVSPAQTRVMEMLEQAGQEVHLWTPADEALMRERLDRRRGLPRARGRAPVPRLGTTSGKTVAEMLEAGRS